MYNANNDKIRITSQYIIIKYDLTKATFMIVSTYKIINHTKLINNTHVHTVSELWKM